MDKKCLTFTKLVNIIKLTKMDKVKEEQEMALTERERVACSLEREIGQEFYEGWGWRGGGFLKVARLQNGGISVLVHLLHTGNGMTVKFFTQTEYGIADEERAFTGDCLVEAVAWVKAKALAVWDEVKARIAPYETGKRLYERALRGGSI